MRDERRQFKLHRTYQLVSHRARFGKFDPYTLIGMHHPDKDFVGMTGEAAATITEDCCGLHSEIELSTECGHALTQKFQWPETEPAFWYELLRHIQEMDESKHDAVGADVLGVFETTEMPVPQSKCSWQSIHSVTGGIEEYPLATYVRRSMLRERQQRFSLPTLDPAGY